MIQAKPMRDRPKRRKPVLHVSATEPVCYGTADGQSFYSDGHVIVAGQMPAKLRRRVELPRPEERQPKELASSSILSIFPPQHRRVKPVAYSFDDENKRYGEIIWFDHMAAFNAMYFDLLNVDEHVEWWVSSTTQNGPMGAWRKGRRVGCVMPMRAHLYANILSVIKEETLE